MTGLQIKIPFDKRICFNCGSKTTYIKKDGSIIWRKVDGNPWCHNCWTRVIWNPKASKITNPQRLRFKDKRKHVKDKPITGTCTVCKKSVGDPYTNSKGETKIIKVTHIHHKTYHDDDILKDTVELCGSCHCKETWKTRRIRK